MRKIGRGAPWLALAAGLLAAGPACAADLPALIRDALRADPAVLEARANEEVAESRLKATQAQQWPVLGLQAGSNVVNPNSYYSTPFRGVTGKLNLYSAGAIGASIERDRYKQQFQQFKIEETREQVAYDVAMLYLQALAGQELVETQQQNLARHQKIIDDLQIIVDNDPGRRYELVQAQSRALQVRTSIVDQEKNMRLALSKLTRFTTQEATLVPL